MSAPSCLIYIHLLRASRGEEPFEERLTLSRARDAAGNRDIRIVGGANAIQQYLNAGLVDEFTIHYSPVFFGHGIPLFANMNPDITVKIREVVPSKEVAHVMYEVEK